MSDIKSKIAGEASRIEEDTKYSAKGHYNASARWGKYHLAIGLTAAVVTAISGLLVKKCPELTLLFASIGTALTTVLTFLKPSERAENHQAVAGQYLSLRNKARIFREIDLEDGLEISAAIKGLKELAAARDDLNQRSLVIPENDYTKARKEIEEGRSTYEVDKFEK